MQSFFSDRMLCFIFGKRIGKLLIFSLFAADEPVRAVYENAGEADRKDA
jgi:hypothetical protein